MARQIAKHFGTLDAIAKATLDDVLAVHGIGDTIAESLVSWFADPKARKLIERLRERGLTFVEPRTQTGDALKGQTVVITGTLPTLSREQATAPARLCRPLGGESLLAQALLLFLPGSHSSARG